MRGLRVAALFALLAPLAAPGLTGCFPDFGLGPSPEVIEAVGTVVFVELEGGFYGIVADDGARYIPRNLPMEFQQDGLRVRFRARILKEVATIYMWGQPIELLHIELVESPRL